jgi:hypothetical protein
VLLWALAAVPRPKQRSCRPPRKQRPKAPARGAVTNDRPRPFELKLRPVRYPVIPVSGPFATPLFPANGLSRGNTEPQPPAHPCLRYALLPMSPASLRERPQSGHCIRLVEDVGQHHRLGKAQFSAVIGCQCLPHVRLRNSELPGNLRWLNTSLEGSADSIQLALRQRKRRLLARLFTGRLV